MKPIFKTEKVNRVSLKKVRPTLKSTRGGDSDAKCSESTRDSKLKVVLYLRKTPYVKVIKYGNKG